MNLKNYMEDLVERTLAQTLSRFDDACACDRCKLDMMAHALNNLPARYVVAERGLTHFNLDAASAQFGSDVLYAVTAAIRLIALRPRHAQQNVGNRLLEEGEENPG